MLATFDSYWDTNCQEYAGEAHPDRYQTVGGPYGARSMLFVSVDQCFDTCSKLSYHHFILFIQLPHHTTDKRFPSFSLSNSNSISIPSLTSNLKPDYMKFCKNPECSAWDKADRIGECKTFQNGVWGQQGCGCI